MRARTAAITAWSTLGLCVVLTAAGWWLSALNVGTPIPEELGDVTPATDSMILLGVLPFSIVGAMIFARRPGNRIGLIFLFTGLGVAISVSASEYAILGLLTDPGSLPGTPWAAWLQLAGIAMVVPIFSLLPLLFPDGILLSRRWIPVALLAAASMLFFLLGSFAPGPIPGFGVRNPVGIRGFGAFLDLGWGPLFLSAVGSIAALIVRFRRSRGDERQQLKWFTFAAAMLVLYFVISSIVFPEVSSPLWLIPLAIGLAALPVATGIAVLKYRLYDIDVVINKALVFGLLALFITIVYGGIVVGVGALVGSGGSPVLSAIAAGVVAVAFQPVRHRAQRLANRVVYGKRATPYEVLSEFSERVGETYAAEDILPRMARILGEGTGAQRAEVWLRSGSELRLAASWPEDLAGEARRLTGDALPLFEDVSAAVPVRHQGELLGALTVTKPPNEPITPAEEKLVADVAGQAGLVLRNAALIEDLRASRKRLVAAQDEERRKLERNLHDGAQQQLVALAVKLRLLESAIPTDPGNAIKLAREVGADAGDALENLRDLARGIYPPLLADKGLPAALEAQARKAPLPIQVEAGGVGRFPQEVEAAVYFSCLEALQNVAKYAEASRARVRLSATDGEVLFSVEDDGRGFDPDGTGYGTGLQGIADRLEALRGSLEVRSEPGSGTTLRGRIPVGER